MTDKVKLSHKLVKVTAADGFWISTFETPTGKKVSLDISQLVRLNALTLTHSH